VSLADAVLSRLDFVADPYAADPVGWARDVLGVHLWSRQREILESVRDNPRTAVRSGHGIGKTLTAAVAVLWFLDTHPRSRVISSAPKWSQVEKLLWHEIGQLHARAQGRPEARDRAVFAVEPLKTEIQLPDGRYGLGLSSKPENSESFAGHHAPHILVVYDEASGIHPSIFEVGEGYMTTDGARALLIGNPTRTTGEFYEAFHRKRAEYATLAISALESPAITGEQVPDEVRAALTGKAWVDGRRRAWGEDSPMFQVRVLGRFARAGDDTVMALGDVEDAQDRVIEPVSPVSQEQAVVGVDVARFGSDETVIAARHCQRVRIVETYAGKPTTFTAGRVAHHARVLREQAGAEPIVVVDDTGVGGGVTDQLVAQGFEVRAFNASARAHDPRRFPNRRSELWFTMTAELGRIDLDDDEQLAADLTAPRYGYDAQMRQVVEAKAETKKRLGRSPDRADAVMLTVVGDAWVASPDDDEDELARALAEIDAASRRLEWWRSLAGEGSPPMSGLTDGLLEERL
jgi:hypothetical protein